MKYCLSHSFGKPFDDDYEWPIWIIEFIYAILAIYIIYKMCQLCSKAFSYTNFHIHEAYKFYALALISTVIIMLFRSLQVSLPLSQAQNPLYQGWAILNEVIGIISIYAVNQMYTLNAMTLLMIVNRCDYTKISECAELDPYELEEQQKKHRLFNICRKGLLYYIIPISMLMSVYMELNYEPGSCIASKIFTMFISSLCYIIFIYSLIKIILQKQNDPNVPKKIKIMWLYLVVAMIARQSEFMIQIIQDFVVPLHKQYPRPPQSTGDLIKQSFFLIFYVIFVSVIPIFILSYLADKQLLYEKQKIDRSSHRIIFSSTII